MPDISEQGMPLGTGTVGTVNGTMVVGGALLDEVALVVGVVLDDGVGVHGTG
jgi:hypothetical protein